MKRIKNDKFVKESFFTYLCLVCAILIFIGDIGNASYNRLLVLGNVFLTGSAFWYLRRKSRWMAVLFLLFLYGFGFFLYRRRLDEQLHSLLYCLVNKKTGSGDFTLLFLALSLLISLFCLFFVLILKKGWLFYGFTLSLLFLSPLFGCWPSWLVLGLLVIFHIGNSVYSTVYQRWSDETEEKNTRAVCLKTGFAAGLLLVFGAFFLALLLPLENRKSWMKESVRFTQSLTHGFEAPENDLFSFGEKVGMDAARIAGSDRGSSGKINRGNLYLSGAVQLELTLSKMPENKIYLKDFTGGSYEGDTWAEADETDFYAEFNSRQEEAFATYLSPAYFERRQFELIRYGKREVGKNDGENPENKPLAEPETQKMEIRPVNGVQNSFFLPYLSSYISRDAGGIYSFAMFSWKEYNDYLEMLEEKPLKWFEQMEKPYRIYAAENYLAVPKERLPRLLALCREHPLEAPEEITAWICKTLADRAAYSQTPGFMPYGTDIAEYFLFDGQEGYCQHFATAAVLLYRMYGIPARYVTGYAAEPADFFLGTDNKYHARLTDDRAHAWAEIYLGGPGWIPVEVTPPVERTGNENNFGIEEGIREEGSYEDGNGKEDRSRTEGRNGEESQIEGGNGDESRIEGGNGDESRIEGSNGDESRIEGSNGGESQIEGSNGDEDRIEDNRGYDWEGGDNGDGEAISEQNPQNHQNEMPGHTGQFPEKQKKGNARLYAMAETAAKMAVTAVITGLVLAGAAALGRKQRKKKLRLLGADELYQKMVALLHLGGYGKGLDGTEPDFCRVIISELEKDGMAGAEPKVHEHAGTFVLSLKELEAIRGYAFQTAYGRETASDEERKKVQKGYERLAARMMNRQHGIKKVKWCVMEAFLVWGKQAA